MNGFSDIEVTVLFSTLVLVLFVGLVVLLLVLSASRRNRFRADMAETRIRHAEQLREVEQEVLRHTLTEVGRELHDNIGQLLTVVRMGVNELLRATDGAARRAPVKEVLDQTIAEVRRLSATLNVDRWEEQTLQEVIAQECARVNSATEVHVAFAHTMGPDFLPAQHKQVLFRIFQELLNNALKHAEADRIDVALSDAEGIRLVVRDNGKGLPVQPKGSGQGLLNIQHRADLIGFKAEFGPAPGHGTEVVVRAVQPA